MTRIEQAIQDFRQKLNDFWVFNEQWGEAHDDSRFAVHDKLEAELQQARGLVISMAGKDCADDVYEDVMREWIRKRLGDEAVGPDIGSHRRPRAF